MHWQKLRLQPLATLLNFFLLVCKLCKFGLWITHYILKMSKYTNIVYIGRYLVLTYIEIFISTVCYIFSLICWSVNCMGWVVNSTIFFWNARKLRQDLYWRALILCNLWKVHFWHSDTFFAFLSSLKIVQETFSATVSVSKLYGLSLWIIEHTSEMSSNIKIDLYLRPCRIASYEKIYLYCLYHLSLFSGL